MTERNVRKLVTMPLALAEAVERFRVSGATPTCPTCHQRCRNGKTPSGSDAIRELIEAGLLAWENMRIERTTVNALCESDEEECR